jgi:hypothetical protein
MDLNNINISDLKEKLLQVADKKTLIKFGIGFGSIILFLIIYYAVLNPIVKTKKVMLDDMTLKQTEISTFNDEIIVFTKRIKKLEPKYKKNSTLFHSKAEVEGLYLSLSKYAGVNGLVISKIGKQKPKPVLKEGVSEDTPDKLNKNNVSYYKIPVNYEIRGNFLGYIKFKRELARSNKMNFFKIIILLSLFFATIQSSFADSHDKKNIVDQAKDLANKAKEIQAKNEQNIKDATEEEEVPLNDPFAGNAATSSGDLIAFDNDSEDQKKLTLNNFKLVGIISGKFESYVSLADSSGKVITIQLNEELEEGLRFVDLRLTEAIFEKEGGKYMVIDFKNKVREVDEY